MLGLGESVMQRKLSAWRFVVAVALLAASVSAISLLPASAEDPIDTPDAERIATGGSHACAVWFPGVFNRLAEPRYYLRSRSR